MTELLTTRDELTDSIADTIRKVINLGGEPVEILLCRDYYALLLAGWSPTDPKALREPMRLLGLLCSREKHIETFVVRFTQDDRVQEASA